MPRSPIEKKRKNYNNGPPTKPSHAYEQNGKKCSPPRSHKRAGWSHEKGRM